jgi:hypothetical protein
VLNEEQLRAWLHTPGGRALSERQLTELLGGQAESIPDLARYRLVFAIEILRDLYTDDAEIRAWFHRSARDLGAAPIELLRDGRVRDIESALVRQWNLRSRAAGRRLTLRVQVGAR